MRILVVSALLLCGLVSLCVASDEPRRAASSRFDSASGIVRPDDLSQGLRDPAVRERLRRELAEDGDVTCYTMQSYLVKRQSRHSDTVDPVGYSTCLAASKYGVKVTKDSEQAPTR